MGPCGGRGRSQKVPEAAGNGCKAHSWNNCLHLAVVVRCQTDGRVLPVEMNATEKTSRCVMLRLVSVRFCRFVTTGSDSAVTQAGGGDSRADGGKYEGWRDVARGYLHIYMCIASHSSSLSKSDTTTTVKHTLPHSSFSFSSVSQLPYLPPLFVQGFDSVVR